MSIYDIIFIALLTISEISWLGFMCWMVYLRSNNITLTITIGLIFIGLIVCTVSWFKNL